MQQASDLPCTTGQADVTDLGLITCHECDYLHRIQPLTAGHKALCSRCGASLYQHIPQGLERALALNLAVLMLFCMANAFPFLSLELSGRIEEIRLVSGALALFRWGLWELGILVFLTSFLFPLIAAGGMFYVLVARRSGSRFAGSAWVYRLVRIITPWSLIGVFMLGVLVSVVKLLDLATVIPGVSLYAFAAMLVVATAAKANFDRHLVWPLQGLSVKQPVAAATATEHNLVGCRGCGLLALLVRQGERGRCPRCGSLLYSRKPDSVTRTWALIVSATLMLVPANVYPVMTVIRFGEGEPNTIISGVIHLIEARMWPLALLVFFASFVVPLVKLLTLTFLLITVQRKSRWRPVDRTRLFRATEVIGAWSMVDVYLVAILSALVNLDALAAVEPGIGVSFFAVVVVLTLLAGHSFDPRLIWDNCGNLCSPP